MTRKKPGRGYLFIPVFLFINLSILLAEHPDTTFRKIDERSHLINQAVSLFNVDAACLKAIVYTERTLNFDWRDDTFDALFAKVGRNSSIGFCQVKLKTAYWIEHTLNDEKSDFYPGKSYHGILKISESSAELLSNLMNDSLNIYMLRLIYAL